ncbi:hypothetical protein D3C86_1682140 [compost metagenome]
MRQEVTCISQVSRMLGTKSLPIERHAVAALPPHHDIDQVLALATEDLPQCSNASISSEDSLSLP